VTEEQDNPICSDHPKFCRFVILSVAKWPVLLKFSASLVVEEVVNRESPLLLLNDIPSKCCT
jgi:hypothetical protein